MRTDSAKCFLQSDPDRNHNFGRRWFERPMSSAELECLADLAASVGNWRRADALSRQAHTVRQERA